MPNKKKRCFVCDQRMSVAPSMITKKKGILKLIESSEQRGDGMHLKLQGCSKIPIHIWCSGTYNRVAHIKKSLRKKQAGEEPTPITPLKQKKVVEVIKKYILRNNILNNKTDTQIVKSEETKEIKKEKKEIEEEEIVVVDEDEEDEADEEYDEDEEINGKYNIKKHNGLDIFDEVNEEDWRERCKTIEAAASYIRNDVGLMIYNSLANCRDNHYFYDTSNIPASLDIFLSNIFKGAKNDADKIKENYTPVAQSLLSAFLLNISNSEC